MSEFSPENLPSNTPPAALSPEQLLGMRAAVEVMAIQGYTLARKLPNWRPRGAFSMWRGELLVEHHKVESNGPFMCNAADDSEDMRSVEVWRTSRMRREWRYAGETGLSKALQPPETSVRLALVAEENLLSGGQRPQSEILHFHEGMVLPAGGVQVVVTGAMRPEMLQRAHEQQQLGLGWLQAIVDAQQ